MHSDQCNSKIKSCVHSLAWCVQRIWLVVKICLTFFLSFIEDGKTLFVKNLTQDVTQEMLEELFDENVEVRLAKRPDGSNKG